jgi:hypothetical protein
VCSKHAIDRIKKRYALPKQAAVRLVEQAVQDGTMHRKQEMDTYVSFNDHGKRFVFAYTPSGHNNMTGVLLLVTSHYCQKPTIPSHFNTMLKGQFTTVKLDKSKVKNVKKHNATRKSNKHKQDFQEDDDE